MQLLFLSPAVASAVRHVVANMTDHFGVCLLPDAISRLWSDASCQWLALLLLLLLLEDYGLSCAFCIIACSTNSVCCMHLVIAVLVTVSFAGSAAIRADWAAIHSSA